MTGRTPPRQSGASLGEVASLSSIPGVQQEREPWKFGGTQEVWGGKG